MKTRLIRLGPALLAAVALCLLTATARCADKGPAVMQAAPDDALAAVVVNHLDTFDANFAKLMQSMKFPPISVVDQLKREFGSGEGLDEKGSWAVALFDGPTPKSPPLSVMFMPVTDYKKYVSALKAKDPTADVTAIELPGNRSSFVGHKGNFAIFPEPSVKDPEALLKRIIANKNGLDTVAASLTDWVVAHDVSAIATPSGVKKGTIAAREGLKTLKSTMAALGGDQAAMATSAFDMYDSILQSVEKDVNVAGFAGNLDDAGAVHFDGRVVYSSEASTTISRATGEKIGAGLTNLPAGPFIFAMEGAFPESLVKSMMPMSLDMIKNAAKGGGQELTPEQVKKVTEAAADAWKGVRSVGMVMGQPKIGESIYAGTVMVIKIDDSQKFVANYARSLQALSEVFKGVNNPLFPSMGVEKTTVAGADGLEITIDMAAMIAQAGKNPGSQEVMKMFVGPSGKMKAYLRPIDTSTAALSYITPDNIKGAMAVLKDPTKSLGSDNDVSQTVSVLPRGAQWTGYMSPRGIMDLGTAILSKAGPAMPFQLPQFPQTPPVGFAVVSATGRLDLSIVVPSGTLKGVGDYIQSMTMRAIQPQPNQPKPQFQ